MWLREAPSKAGPYLLTRSIASPLIDSTASGLSHANCPSACRVEPIEGGKERIELIDPYFTHQMQRYNLELFPGDSDVLKKVHLVGNGEGCL
jgi:hypothetical protein